MILFKGANVGDFVAVLRHGHLPRKVAIEAITWTQVTVEGVKYGVAAGAAMVGMHSHSRITPWTKEIEEALLAASEEFRRSERRNIAVAAFAKAAYRITRMDSSEFYEDQVVGLETLTVALNTAVDGILGGSE